MLTFDDVVLIRDAFVQKWRAYDMRNKRPTGLFKGKADELPEYYPGYRSAVEMLEQIEIHADKLRFPDKLFANRSPNETDVEFKYRKANYKNTTAPVFVDYVNTVSRANSDQNWSFKADEDLYNYVSSGPPIYGSLYYFLRNYLTPLKAKDANGIIAVQPYQVKTSTDAEGNTVVSDELIEPVPIYYSSRDVVGQGAGWYLVKSAEKSEVMHNGKSEKKGLVLFLFDSQSIYRIEQTGKYIDYEFTAPFVWYPHGLGYVPCIKLKGMPALNENGIIYVSPFSSAADLLDLCLLDESNLFAIKATTVYNYKVAIGTPCTFERGGERCRDGQIFDSNLNGGVGGMTDCPACHGAGLRPRMSPFGVMLINPGNTFNPDGDKGLGGDYLRLISPPIEAPKFIQEQIEKNEHRARKILHLPDADSSVTGNEGATATGSLNKARSTYSFIKPISDQTFEIYEFIISTINKMRYSEPQKFDLSPPQSFDIITPSDMLAVIGELSELNLPPALITAYIDKYVSSLMYTSDDAMNVFKLIMNEDLLLSMSCEDVNLRVSGNMIEKWRDTLHYGGMQILTRLIEDNANFFSQPYDTQREQFIQAAKDATIQSGLTPAEMAAEEMRKIASFGV